MKKQDKVRGRKVIRSIF